MNQDSCIRATGMEGKVRLFAVRTTDSLEEIRRRHQLSPVASAALGRTVSAAAMMGTMLKGEEKLTVQVKGDGPLGQIVADANAAGEVRGYVDNPQIDLPLNAIGKLDVRRAVGEGALYVTKDLGLKEPYRGSVPIVSGELAEDFTYYFAKSEQTPSAVALGVLVDRDYSIKNSGGLILQLLPGLEESEIASLEQKMSALASVTALMEQGMNLEELIRSVVADARILDRTDIVFKCKCSRERVIATLMSLGSEEVSDMAEQDGQAEVVCHFCNEAYHFDKADLLNMLEDMRR